MKNDKEKRSKIWWIIAFIFVIIAFEYGLITAEYHVFPYREIKHIKNVLIDGKKASFKHSKKKSFGGYYSIKESFFKVNGSKADIIMIGDSITDCAEWNELFPNISVLNRGIWGDTTKGVLNRMDSLYSTNAKKAFVMIGVNDLVKKTSVDDVFSNYKMIVVKLKQHGINPYIQSVLLLGDKNANINEHIVKLNLKLKWFSEKENIVFIDLNKVLSENGRLKKSFSSDDVHLNGYGYSIWKNSIKKYMQ